MAEETKEKINNLRVSVDPEIANMDRNGDEHISKEEYEMDMEFKRKKLEDEDAMRDAQRNMAWFALFGMLLYPFAVVIAVALGLDQASKILGAMEAVYFVSVTALGAAFFGTQEVRKSSQFRYNSTMTYIALSNIIIYWD